jgi:hypothetical protein
VVTRYSKRQDKCECADVAQGGTVCKAVFNPVNLKHAGNYLCQRPIRSLVRRG